MDEENIHKQEFHIRSLLTRSVTLYPARAQIIRDIDDITLQPGANEIIIYGLTPTADESSIKVNGKGAATITDMMVELIPNKDRYEDVYPSESDDDVENTDDDESETDSETDLIKGIRKEAKENEDSLKEAKEKKASASSRLAMLDHYSKSLEKDRPKDLEGCIRSYSDERQKAFQDYSSSEANIHALDLERVKIMKRQAKAMRATIKEKEKVDKEKAKKLEKKHRARQDKLDAKTRLKIKRIGFWPKKVYRITLSLDTNSDMTPASSRRPSIDTLPKPLSENSSGSCQVSLSISYITSSAFWLPRYDLSLNTPTSSGVIVYRAEFCNTTSETWKDAKVVLSTSQTSCQGIGEPIPSLVPWLIHLSKIFGNQSDNTSGALFSTYEMEHKRKGQVDIFKKTSEPRHALFGLDDGSYEALRANSSSALLPIQQQQPMQQQQQMRLYKKEQAPMPPSAAAAFGAAAAAFGSNNAGAPGGALFGSAVPSTRGSNNAGAPGSALFGSAVSSTKGSRMARQAIETEIESMEDDEYEANADTIIPDLPELTTQESAWSESGLTATYDIPGLRTIAPSHTTRRQKIASINLKDVHLSYVLVPKLRAAAFLKARFRNTSSITLLKGPAGLTLDGSFLGNTNLPRCSAGESISLSLGVDPSINVAYSKPIVKRSQTGVFQKEGSGVYTRTCTITNTKPNRALEGYVLDQIPMSEDERLKVEVIQPSGLRNEGDVAKSGTAIAAAGNTTEKWGRATAVLKKGGEICWDVKIEPGRSVKLVLEYETRFPSSEVVVGA